MAYIVTAMTEVTLALMLTGTRDWGFEGCLLSHCLWFLIIFKLPVNSSKLTKEPCDQRGKRSFPASAYPIRNSDWLSFSHVPFPAPITLVRRMEYCDWLKLSHMFTPWSGGKGRGILDLQVTQLAFIFRWHRLCVFFLSLVPASRINTSIIPTPTIRKEECGAAEVSTLIQLVCGGASVCMQVWECVKYELVAWNLKMCVSSVFPPSPREDSYRIAGLLSKDSLFTIMHDTHQ